MIMVELEVARVDGSRGCSLICKGLKGSCSEWGRFDRGSRWEKIRSGSGVIQAAGVRSRRLGRRE